MTVAQLIEELQKMPPHAEIFMQITWYKTDGEFDANTYQTSPMIVRWEGNHVEIE